MSIHIYEDMEQNESATSKSGSEKISPTSTAFSSQSPSPGLTNSYHNGGVTIGDVNFPIPGWPKLARTIADKTAFAAFPSFTDLNVKSILYYQAALIRLRKELHKTEFQDYFHGNNAQGHFAEDLDWLLDSENTDPEKNPEQFKILEKIRVILDKYNNALIQFSQISAFPEADSSNVESLRSCAMRICDGKTLTGSGSQVWGSALAESSGTQKSFWRLVWRLFAGFFKTLEIKRDKVPQEFQEHLIVPRGGSKPDGLTLWVVYSFIPLYHYVWKKCGGLTWTETWDKVKGQLPKCHLPRHRQDSNASHVPEDSNGDKAMEKSLTAYSKSWILHVTSILTTIVACLLPIVAIVVLSRVHTMGMILGLIALFNSVFAFGLALISSTSSRVEIFTATAAFSAVMVVFVQNKISQN